MVLLAKTLGLFIACITRSKKFITTLCTITTPTRAPMKSVVGFDSDYPLISLIETLVYLLRRLSTCSSVCPPAQSVCRPVQNAHHNAEIVEILLGLVYVGLSFSSNAALFNADKTVQSLTARSAPIRSIAISPDAQHDRDAPLHWSCAASTLASPTAMIAGPGLSPAKFRFVLGLWSYRLGRYSFDSSVAHAAASRPKHKLSAGETPEILCAIWPVSGVRP